MIVVVFVSFVPIPTITKIKPQRKVFACECTYFLFHSTHVKEHKKAEFCFMGDSKESGGKCRLSFPGFCNLII